MVANLHPGAVLNEMKELLRKRCVLFHFHDGQPACCYGYFKPEMLRRKCHGLFNAQSVTAVNEEISARLDVLIVFFIERHQGFVTGLLGGFEIGCAVDEIAEALMIRAVAILFHKIYRLFDHKCDMRGIGNRCRLLECQMTIAQNLLILRKPHQVKKHKVKLLSRVLKKPRLVLLYAPSEELVRVAEIPVHRRLRNRVGHRLMLVETLINVIYHDPVFLRKRPRNGRLAAAGRACDKVHIFQILFNYIVLEYHNLSPFESIVSS